MKKTKSAMAQPEPLEPHELAGKLTHQQRLKLADGLVALFHRKEAEDAARKGAEQAQQQ